MVAQNGPKMAQNGPNWPKMPINGNLKVAVVKNRENSLERRWNKLGEVQANVFGPIWAIFGQPYSPKTVRKSGHFADISLLNLQTLKLSPYKPV